jgi:Zn-dependent peptidase ImmA (M78 family)
MLKTERDEIIGVRAGAARNAARTLLKRSKVKTAPVFINELVPVLKRDYDLKAIKGLDLADHLSGFLIQESQLSAIAYNKTHHIHRQRFTTAHEIGHLVLGHNVIDEGSVSDNEETEANIFASELLMPLEFIKQDIKKGGFSVPGLAEKYLVSEQAMGHRFQDPAVLRCF